jgi:hypothetical protein
MGLPGKWVFMNKISFKIPTRIPQLYYSASAAPREKTGGEKLADGLYIFLVILSYALFILGAVVGYLQNKLYGLALYSILGYGAGVWIRRSLGIRGIKPTTGFFVRMRERSLGSKPGFLEITLERISGKPFTPEKCRAVTQAREKAVKQLKQATNKTEQTKILADLDKSVNRILYR